MERRFIMARILRGDGDEMVPWQMVSCDSIKSFKGLFAALLPLTDWDGIYGGSRFLPKAQVIGISSSANVVMIHDVDGELQRPLHEICFSRSVFKMFPDRDCPADRFIDPKVEFTISDQYWAYLQSKIELNGTTMPPLTTITWGRFSYGNNNESIRDVRDVQRPETLWSSRTTDVLSSGGASLPAPLPAPVSPDSSFSKPCSIISLATASVSIPEPIPCPPPPSTSALSSSDAINSSSISSLDIAKSEELGIGSTEFIFTGPMTEEEKGGYIEDDNLYVSRKQADALMRSCNYLATDATSTDTSDMAATSGLRCVESYSILDEDDFIFEDPVKRLEETACINPGNMEASYSFSSSSSSAISLKKAAAAATKKTKKSKKKKVTAATNAFKGSAINRTVAKGRADVGKDGRNTGNAEGITSVSTAVQQGSGFIPFSRLPDRGGERGGGGERGDGSGGGGGGWRRSRSKSRRSDHLNAAANEQCCRDAEADRSRSAGGHRSWSPGTRNNKNRSACEVWVPRRDRVSHSSSECRGRSRSRHHSYDKQSQSRCGRSVARKSRSRDRTIQRGSSRYPSRDRTTAPDDHTSSWGDRGSGRGSRSQRHSRSSSRGSRSRHHGDSRSSSRSNSISAAAARIRLPKNSGSNYYRSRSRSRRPRSRSRGRSHSSSRSRDRRRSCSTSDNNGRNREDGNNKDTAIWGRHSSNSAWPSERIRVEDVDYQPSYQPRRSEEPEVRYPRDEGHRDVRAKNSTEDRRRHDGAVVTRRRRSNSSSSCKSVMHRNERWGWSTSSTRGRREPHRTGSGEEDDHGLRGDRYDAATRYRYDVGGHCEDSHNRRDCSRERSYRYSEEDKLTSRRSNDQDLGRFRGDDDDDLTTSRIFYSSATAGSSMSSRNNNASAMQQQQQQRRSKGEGWPGEDNSHDRDRHVKGSKPEPRVMFVHAHSECNRVAMQRRPTTPTAGHSTDLTDTVDRSRRRRNDDIIHCDDDYLSYNESKEEEWCNTRSSLPASKPSYSQPPSMKITFTNDRQKLPRKSTSDSPSSVEAVAEEGGRFLRGRCSDRGSDGVVRDQQWLSGADEKRRSSSNGDHNDLDGRDYHRRGKRRREAEEAEEVHMTVTLTGRSSAYLDDDQWIVRNHQRSDK